MRFKFAKYMIPSVVSMVVVGSNANIDGLFIGNIMGDDGLAAINIVWPIVAFAAAAGTGIGTGGAVMLNRLRGMGEKLRAETVKNTALIFLVIFGIAASVLLCLFRSSLLSLMGAEGRVFELASDYALVIGGGAAAQICGAGIVALLRNDGKTYEGMVLSVTGLVMHIVLDALLAKDMGMKGVAAATVISQAVISVAGYVIIKKNRGAGVRALVAGEILKSAAAPFGLNFVPSLVLMFTNYFALRSGGTAAVSAYAVMSYAVYTFDYIFQGVCDGVQPAISYSCGSGDVAVRKEAVKRGALILGIMSVLFSFSTPLLIGFMPKLFAVSETAEKMMDTGFIIYAFAYPFKAAAKFICAYYYACGEKKKSNILVYLDPLILTPSFLVLGSAAIGTNGVWAAMTAAQTVLCAAGIICILISNRKKTAEE